MGLLHLLFLALPALALAVDFKPYNTTALIIFEDIDFNHDGNITFAEIDEYFDEFDTDGSGNLTRHEFAKFIDARYPSFFHYESLVWDQFDFNNDNHLTDLDFEHVIDLHDQDHDKIVTQAEFVPYFGTLLRGLEIIIDLMQFETDLNMTMTTAATV